MVLFHSMTRRHMINTFKVLVQEKDSFALASGIIKVKLSTTFFYYSVIVSVCRGPCARDIYSTHGNYQQHT